MDPKDLLDYIKEGALWLTLGGGTYFSLLFGCQIFCNWPFRKKIKSQEELEEIVEEEATRLGLDFTKINAKYYENVSIAAAKKDKERYELYLGGWDATRNSVCHELYHIYKGDLEHRSCLRYLLIEELRATLYETFSIKL